MKINRWKVIVFFTVFIIIGITIIIAFCQDKDKTYSLATLETTSGYVVDIRAESLWELVQSIFCTVTKNGETIFPLKWLGDTKESHKLKFMLIEGGKNDELVAIVEELAPHVIVALYDVKNHKSWHLSAGWPEEQTMREELLKQLNKSNTEKPLIFADMVKDGVELRIP